MLHHWHYFTLLRDVSKAPDTALLFHLTSLYDVINAAPVTLGFNLILLPNVSNVTDAALMFDCHMDDRNMSIVVVC